MSTRRDALKLGLAVGGSALAAPESGLGQLCLDDGISPSTVPPSPPTRPFIAPLFIPPIAQPVPEDTLTPRPNPGRHQRYGEFRPRKFYVQREQQFLWLYHPDLPPTPTWGWDGVSPGATFHAYYGEPIFVRRYNDLPEVNALGFGLASTTIHLHNSHTASESDGYPGDWKDPGEFWDHHYANYEAGGDERERMTSLWYHDHRMDFTAPNVYAGLSGFYFLFDPRDSNNENDPSPQACRLPSGRYDIPLMLHDVQFAPDDRAVFDPFQTDGWLGDKWTVNRIVQPYVRVEPRKYRFRVQNGGPSRYYELFLSSGQNFVVITTDGNFLERPVEAESINVAVAQRHDVIIDFSRYRPGETVDLVNRLEQFEGRGPSGRILDPGDPILRFQVVEPAGPDGKPVKVTQIDPTSPSQVIKSVLEQVRDQARASHTIDRVAIQRGIDVIEGNRLPEYPWSGFPLLHYIGPTKVKKVVPIWNVEGDTIGGNVNVHQVWYDSHIESDAAFIDPSEVLDVPWTITYTIDCLHRCADDFSPAAMYFDAPPADGSAPFGPPHIGMDLTFFPMEDGTRTVFKLKMAPGKYYNLTYTWGWRVHPPRVQVSENATKLVGGKNIVQWEIDTFGPNPWANEAAKLAAIAKIGELSPAKQMWMALRQAREETEWSQVVTLMDRALIAYFDWSDRTELPTGAKHLEDPEATMSMLYVNNTIYGKIKDGGWDTWREWETRPAIFKVSRFNGDHFPHGYISADFGGSRGWENQFEPTIAEGGTGCKFSFGRFHWWLNAGGPWGAIIVPPVDPNDYTNVGRHKVHMTLNFEPSRRIRIYQFDPLHHDVSIFSLH